MPAKAPLDENVKFLYSCLIRSDYKTIDFSRVAADFAINPAAARMRWSRLKKSINPDDMWSQPILETLPKKIKKKGLKVPKEEGKEEQEEKSIKAEVKELGLEDAAKNESTPRKAKLRAGKRIGVVVKDEQKSDVDDDGEGEVNFGDKGEEEDMFQAPLESEQPAMELAAASAVAPALTPAALPTMALEVALVMAPAMAPVTASVAAPQYRPICKIERPDDTLSQLPLDDTQNKGIPEDSQTSSLPLDLFLIPPEPSILPNPPAAEVSSPELLPKKEEGGGDDDDDDDGWGVTIVVKHEASSDIKTPVKRKFSAALGSTSPASSMSSFSPPFSAHSSPSPSRTPRKSERTPQKWRAIVSRSGQPRSKSRKIYSEDNEADDEAGGICL